MARRTSRWLSIVSVMMAVAVLGACDNSTSPTEPNQPTANGTLTILLQDSPFSSAQAMLVTFSSVSAHLSGGDFQALPFSSSATRTCDLKRLNGATDVLGTGALPAGHYTQIRLIVTGATLYFDQASTGSTCASTITPPSGTSALVTVPSGTVDLNHEFDVRTNQTTTITLDFNGDQSVRQSGSGTYEMTPVISVVSVQ